MVDDGCDEPVKDGAAALPSLVFFFEPPYDDVVFYNSFRYNFTASNSALNILVVNSCYDKSFPSLINFIIARFFARLSAMLYLGIVASPRAALLLMRLMDGGLECQSRTIIGQFFFLVHFQSRHKSSVTYYIQ